MARLRLKVPHTLVLLFGMVVLAQLLTYVLPQGSYERVEHDGHEVVVPDSYHRIEDGERLPAWSFLTAVPRGMAAAADIIFLCLIVGGTFGVLRASGAADALIGFLLEHLGGRPALLILGAMAAFAMGSSTIGMAEEYLPFVPILVALCLGAGYDRMTAVGTLCVGYAVGYGCATVNPFTVLIAQDIAGLPPTSGLGFRLALIVPFLAIGFHHVYRYARRVEADPASSLVADIPVTEDEMPSEAFAMSRRHVSVMGILLAGLALLVFGIQRYGWYLEEMDAIFLVLAILIGAIAGLGPSRIAASFVDGATGLTGTALLIGFARGIQVVLDDGMVVDTIIHGVAQPLAQMGAVPAAVGMLVFQSLCNFFIPSGSGQAFVTMPLMAPLADVVGVSRQVAVLAYQFGDGFTNIFVPTNAVLVGILAMARVPLDRWFRFILPFMLKIWLACAVALAIAVWIGYS